jgi:hypothetical protein
MARVRGVPVLSRSPTPSTLRQWLLRFLGLCMALGYPIACLALLYASQRRHNWVANVMDTYPLFLVATLVCFIGPLLIAGWLLHTSRKS